MDAAGDDKGNPAQPKNPLRDYFQKTMATSTSLVHLESLRELIATKESIEGLLPENYGHINKPGTPRKLEAPGITNLDKTSKKIFRARKTMAASCRQQIATISKTNVSAMMNSAKELTKEESVQHEETEMLAETNYNAPESSTETPGIEGKLCNGLPEVAQDDYQSDSGCFYKREPTNGIHLNTTAAAGSPAQFSPIEDLNDARGHNVEHQKMHFSHISSVGDSSLPASDGTKDCSPKNIDNLCSESETERTNEDSPLKLHSTVGLLTPMDVLPGDSSNAAIPSHETNPSSTIDTSSMTATNFNLTRLENSASLEFSEDSNSASGGCKRKHNFSGDGDDSKRAKTTNKSLLDEIHNIIETRIQTVFKESFDQRIQDLSQQISLIQSKGHHADSIAVHVRRIRRLGKRIKYALEVQNEVGIRPSKSQPVNDACNQTPLTQPATISPTNMSSAEIHTENNPLQNLRTDNPNLVVLSDNESEQQSNPEKDKIRNPMSLPKKADNEAIRKLLESIKEHRKKNLSSKVAENGKTIIDLTDDEEHKSDKDSERNKTASSSPVQENGNGLPQSLESKEEKAAHHEEKHSLDVNERISSVPKSTQTVKAYDSEASGQMAPDAHPDMQKPPQKPELRLAQVQNPKGIALSWNITQVDPSCAPAKVYCLYVNQENPNSSKKLWKKIGEIKALPLPMACTLTQFVDDATYSFALRAKDTFGRFGPLCDIQSTTLKSLTTLKKM